ncbi:hypothetical protein COOONC_01576 [Cooperia oncophora]
MEIWQLTRRSAEWPQLSTERLGFHCFLLFVKEEGNLFRNVFIFIYNRISKWRRKHCGCNFNFGSRNGAEDPEGTPNAEQNGEHLVIRKLCIKSATNNVIHHDLLNDEIQAKKTRFARKYSTTSLLGQKSLLDEQRRVFIAGVLFFVLYILLSSLMFSITTEFDYFTSVYFLFNSVALIGFGDVFPKEPRTILVNAVFIVFGMFSGFFPLMKTLFNRNSISEISEKREAISRVHLASEGCESFLDSYDPDMIVAAEGVVIGDRLQHRQTPHKLQIPYTCHWSKSRRANSAGFWRCKRSNAFCTNHCNLEVQRW